MIETAGATPAPPPPSRGRTSGGISAATAIVVVTVVTVVTAMLSAATGRGFGIAFNLVYLLVTLYAALRIRVSDRFVAVVAPPIVYALAVLAGGFVDTEEPSRTVLRVVEDTFVNVSLGAPWLVTATAAAIVIAIVRGRRETVRSRRR